jgi:hypothetical protein
MGVNKEPPRDVIMITICSKKIKIAEPKNKTRSAGQQIISKA